MDRDAVLARFDRQMRQDVRADGPNARVERTGAVVRRVGAEDDWSAVLWSDLDEATADAEIAEQARYFSSLGREFEWKLYGYDAPRDLGARLGAAGFVPEPEETLMIAETAALRTDAEPPPGVQVHRVTDAAGVDLVVQVHETVFGMRHAFLRKQLLDQLAHDPDAVSIVVAMAGELPVCSARMELYASTDFAGLWGGGTLPAWRGRGIYRALVAHRARIAAARGFRYLQVDASDDSRPVLQRLGFAPLTTTRPYLYGA
ncbi:GNAT family N-acetyltransferase [Streptomyces sp. NPDC051776]|uniref:GNAT family N-acetyltransferase n=1 Tax=Streptomyces sp. NPDC051776 TaxID=3155414 RepID=UPI003444AFAE